MKLPMLKLPAKKEKKRRKYRLRPEAKRFYQRLLLIVAAVGVAAVTLRLTVFRKTFSVPDYNPAQPFAMGDLLRAVVKPKNPGDLIVLDAVVQANGNGVVTSIHLDLAELMSEKKYRGWTLDVSNDQAKMKKGDTVNENYSSQRDYFPPLDSTLECLGRIPLTKICTQQPLSDTQYVEFSTKGYSPNVNPSYAGKAGQDADVYWVPIAGEVSLTNDEWKAISDYMAMDCNMMSTLKGSTPQLQAILLLEAKLE